MTGDEKVRLDEQFAKIAETRRPASLEWLSAHRERLERLRLEPDFMAYTLELLFAKVEDLNASINRLLAIQAANGQRGRGHLGLPPQPAPGRKN